MFCPTCGKDNSLELKYCASCGTNLEAVSQALSGSEEDFFTKMDSGIDHFIARYAEHVFRDAPHGISNRAVSKSWKLLGQAIVTSFLDILLFFLVWNLLPLRFLILIISTPFRLLAARNQPVFDGQPALKGGYEPPALAHGDPGLWLADSAPSVAEHTTMHLKPSEPSRVKPPVTDQLER